MKLLVCKASCFIISLYRESSVLIQIILDNISKLLGFDLEKGKFQGAVEENKAIEIMGQLLDRINNMDIYNLSADDDNEEKFWFMYSKQLPQILFTAERFVLFSFKYTFFFTYCFFNFFFYI